ncbi:hypothetical protein [Algoriphagus machipongonensis]|uniref:Uncharacterized protein n=1 Tax=Algoriphagus machipongonensis TaxID=388413 RepID=A3HVU4_9BACT|nr:hypothetical protein [Algoriphagus machipongonensis]EAZ82266.1 hypothetical protein ALPR1_03455 [Algoriphagus machipongonensis]
MKISSRKGTFKIIQTIKNRDELLVLASWNDIAQQFGSNRAFLVNKSEGLFGVYLCKQECSEFISELLMAVDFNEWEEFNMRDQNASKRYSA